LMNDDFVIHQSQLLSDKLTQEHDHLESRVIALFTETLLREPDEQEITLLISYARQHGLANTCRYLFNSNAFIFIE
ncbi:MAG: hypothetical protein HOH33_07040, partial [Verrucomicrobia bacterium]|nr:hypothetical protein [Verrucomicrobiota bacterium]